MQQEASTSEYDDLKRLIQTPSKRLGAASKMAYRELYFRVRADGRAKIVINWRHLAELCGCKDAVSAKKWVACLEKNGLVSVVDRNEEKGTALLYVYKPFPGPPMQRPDLQKMLEFPELDLPEEGPGVCRGKRPATTPSDVCRDKRPDVCQDKRPRGRGQEPPDANSGPGSDLDDSGDSGEGSDVCRGKRPGRPPPDVCHDKRPTPVPQSSPHTQPQSSTTTKTDVFLSLSSLTSTSTVTELEEAVTELVATIWLAPERLPSLDEDSCRFAVEVAAMALHEDENQRPCEWIHKAIRATGRKMRRQPVGDPLGNPLGYLRKCLENRLHEDGLCAEPEAAGVLSQKLLAVRGIGSPQIVAEAIAGLQQQAEARREASRADAEQARNLTESEREETHEMLMDLKRMVRPSSRKKT